VTGKSRGSCSGRLLWGAAPHVEDQTRGRPILYIVPLDRAILVAVDPVGNFSARGVVDVGHRGGAGNAELGPCREEVFFVPPLMGNMVLATSKRTKEVFFLAWQNADLDPPHVLRPR